MLFEMSESPGLALFACPQDGEGFIAGEGVLEVAEVDGGDDLLGGHVGEQAPDGFAFGAGVEVPDSVKQRTTGEVDDALIRAEPAQLGVAGELKGKGVEVPGDVAELPAFHERREVVEGADDDVGAPAEREGEAVAFHARRGFEDAVGGGIVGVGVHGIGADVLARGREADVKDPHPLDQSAVQNQCPRSLVGGAWRKRRKRTLGSTAKVRSDSRELRFFLSMK